MIYCVSPFAQKKEVTELCFKKCGKIIIGAINICGGSFFPCREKVCKYEERNTGVISEVNGEKVIVRKLKGVNDA